MSPAELFFRELLTATPDAAVVEGLDGQVLAVNPGFLNLVNWTTPYQGQSLDDLLVLWQSNVARPEVLEDYFRNCRAAEASVAPAELEPQPGVLLYAQCLLTRAIRSVPCRIWFFREYRNTSHAWVTHEVKHPLNAILGVAERLAKSAAVASTSEEAQHLVQGLRLSSRQLLAVLTDQSSPEWVNLKDFLEEISLLNRERFRHRGLEFLVDAPGLDVQLWVDPVRLRQILDNLLGNALEFTSKGWVALRVVDQGGAWSFSVEDTGVGIALSRQKDLLKTDAGLGLLICRTLAGRLGGALAFESEPGHGSKFTLSLPGLVARPAQERERNISILVADDEKMIHLLIQSFLKGLPVTILEAHDGAEAVEVWMAHRPDLVLMDLRMPKLSGVEAARRIYTFDPTSPTKILAMSGMRPAEGELIGGRRLWSGYLEKPFTQQELLRLVTRFVTLKGEKEPGA